MGDSKMMKCLNCGYKAKENKFKPTEILGERVCPKCDSSNCYENSPFEAMIEIEPTKKELTESNTVLTQVEMIPVEAYLKKNGKHAPKN